MKKIMVSLLFVISVNAADRSFAIAPVFLNHNHHQYNVLETALVRQGPRNKILATTIMERIENELIPYYVHVRDLVHDFTYDHKALQIRASESNASPLLQRILVTNELRKYGSADKRRNPIVARKELNTLIIGLNNLHARLTYFVHLIDYFAEPQNNLQQEYYLFRHYYFTLLDLRKELEWFSERFGKYRLL